MIPFDANTCRRALREMREIAVAHHLGGGPMTDHEALDTIRAIARWVGEASSAPRDAAGCAAVVDRLNLRLAGVRPHQIDDATALTLFAEVMEDIGSGR